MRILKQSTAVNVMVFMTQAADHVTGITGATLTITASKNGGAFASITPTVTERGTGWYNLALDTAMTDTLGDLALHITAASADPSDLYARVVVRPFDDLAFPNVSGRGMDVSAGGDVDADAAGVRTAVGLAAANLDTQLDALPTAAEIRVEMDANSVDLNTIISRVDVATSTRAVAGDSMALTAGAVDALWDEVLEGGYTARELVRGFAAALLAKLSGANLNAPLFRDLADTKNRITATTDASGNRSVVTLDLT
jgi:hypothetical protein